MERTERTEWTELTEEGARETRRRPSVEVAEGGGGLRATTADRRPGSGLQLRARSPASQIAPSSTLDERLLGG